MSPTHEEKSDPPKPRRRIAIVGAGPAGLTAAAEFSGTDYDVTVLEQDACYVGGLSRTVVYKGCRFDIGGHRFFSKNPEIVKWWKDRLPNDFLRVKRKSRILYLGKFYDYPLRPGNALTNLGIAASAACVLSYLWSRLFPHKPEHTFEEWVSNRFGRKLFTIFFKTYTEKVWGIPCDQISADWASQRIKGLSLVGAIFHSFGGRANGLGTVKTLIEAFDYPRLGPGMMWEKTRDDLACDGIEVRMGRAVEEIHHEDKTVTFLRTKTPAGVFEDWAAEQFITSMPLRDTVMKMRPRLSQNVEAAALSLQYRDFITVALVVRGENLFPDNWIYIHDPGVRVGRVQNFNNWSAEMQPSTGVTCLGLEYFCASGDSLWKLSDAALIELATQEAEAIGLISTNDLIDACVVRMEKAYPVYDALYQERLAIIQKALSGFRNLQPVGRNGLHKYNNQDHSMMTALLAARNIKGAQFDVWKVNTDAEYQESSELSRPEVGRMRPKSVK